jgi:hypothetical protein
MIHRLLTPTKANESRPTHPSVPLATKLWCIYYRCRFTIDTRKATVADSQLLLRLKSTISVDLKSCFKFFFVDITNNVLYFSGLLLFGGPCMQPWGPGSSVIYRLPSNLQFWEILAMIQRLLTPTTPLDHPSFNPSCILYRCRFTTNPCNSRR